MVPPKCGCSKRTHNLPPLVCKALLRVYEHLSDRKLIQGCQRAKNQNSNDSLHFVKWSLAPKERHASLFTVEAAVTEAVMRFNAGNAKTFTIILKELSFNPGPTSAKRVDEKDKHWETDSTCKCAAADSLQGILKKRHFDVSKQLDYVHGGY